MKKIITNNEKETFAFGAALGRHCRGGEVFALSGELGAGKTKLIQGLAKGLGVKARVNSPTFNILKVYKIKGQAGQVKPARQARRARQIRFFCHIDAYRLKSAKSLVAIGVKEFFNSPDTVTAIEWAEKVRKILPKRAKMIKIRCLEVNGRVIIIK